MKHIAVIGEICLDIIMHNPNSIEVGGEKLWAEDIIATIGGSAALTSAALSHLGEQVRVHGTLGDDEAGRKILGMLREAKVDCGDITILPDEKTTHSMIICKSEQKNFLGCSAMLPLKIPSIESLDDTKLVYIAGFMLYKEFWTDESFAYFAEAHRRGIPIVTDGQWTGIDSFDLNPNAREPLERILSISSAFLAAQKELRYLEQSHDGSKEAEYLLKTGLKTAVLKRGKDGAIAFDKNGRYRSKGFLVDVYDTIGSGDIFGAAYAYGVVNDWPVSKCVEFACVFAACSLLRYEEQKQYPSKESVLDIIKNRRRLS